MNHDFEALEQGSVVSLWQIDLTTLSGKNEWFYFCNQLNENKEPFIIYNGRKFKGDVKYIQDLDGFFTRHKGVKSFKWTAPDRAGERRYVTRGMKQTFINANFRSLSVEVRESLI